MVKFSIVTISYNQAQFLRQCIESVLGQDYPWIEYIVVDPGSTDGSREIIDSYGSRIVKVYEKDQGPADGLNRGFQCATGDIFGFINSDDYLLPDALSALAGRFSVRDEPDVVSGEGFAVDQDGRVLRGIVPTILTPWMYAHGAVSIFQQGTFFRSKLFEMVGGFNVNNGTCWDGELFLDMALHGAKFVTIENRVAAFRLHAGGITGSGRLAQRYAADLERLFFKAIGRPRCALDLSQDFLARLAKPLITPSYLLRRLRGSSAALQ